MDRNTEGWNLGMSHFNFVIAVSCSLFWDTDLQTRGILATWTISPARGTLPQYLVTTH